MKILHEKSQTWNDCDMKKMFNMKKVQFEICTTWKEYNMVESKSYLGPSQTLTMKLFCR